jgi:hypothetical protein
MKEFDTRGIKLLMIGFFTVVLGFIFKVVLHLKVIGWIFLCTGYIVGFIGARIHISIAKKERRERLNRHREEF